MENQQNTDGICKGLSITSLAVSILGFLTGWLSFGVFFDFIGILLGVIAVIIGRKKNAPSGIAIAGIIIGALGAVTMFLIWYLPTIWRYFNPSDPKELPAVGILRQKLF